MFDIHTISLWFKKNLHAKDVLTLILLICFFFTTRLINLKELPIFNDEGIYIHWAKVAWHDASWRFVSLTDGKQPLQTWGTIPFLKLFPNDALLAGRLFSVCTGFFALTGMITLLFYLFGKKSSYIGGFLYIVTPYFLFYDRMAMIDSGVNAFFIWMLFFSILLAQTIRVDVALVSGILTGFALLAKSSVKLFVGLSFLAPILFIDQLKKKTVQKGINFYILFGISGVIGFFIYNIQRLSPFFHFVSQKNNTFVMTFSEWLQKPFEVVFHQSRMIPYYVASEMGWAPIIFAVLGMILLYQKNKRLCLYLLLWIILPYIAISFMTKVLFPRYIIFFGSLFTIFASYWIGQQKKTSYRILALSTVVAFSSLYLYAMWFDYQKIPFPQTDRGQYIEGITVGYGAKEIIDYAREKSKEKPVLILAEGDFGMSGDILDTFIRPHDRIFIKGYWPLGEKEIRDNMKELEEKYVFVVLAHQLTYPQDWPVKLLNSYYKPNKDSVIHLLEIVN